MSNHEPQRCWPTPPRPAPELLERLRRGQLVDGSLDSSVDERVDLLRRDQIVRPAVLVGMGTCGRGAGAYATRDAVRRYLSDTAQTADVVEVGCLGLCSEEPLVDVQLPGRTRLSFRRVGADSVATVLDGALRDRPFCDHLLGQHRSAVLEPYSDVPYLDEHPFFAPQLRWVLANSGIIDPSNLDEYIARGGYSALARTFRERTPDEVCEIVHQSGLRGRGGGGFPTGLKWKLARKSQLQERVLICNADEGDPGAFMDRAVAESDPHRLIEGLVLAAYAIGAATAYIYIRAEYPLAVERLTQAITQARSYGLAGSDILRSGIGLEISIKMGAGAFVCGEETALIHSIEGRRGMPRPRPPYPTEHGLHGSPTVINNVETLANVPGLLARGAAAFRAVGTEASAGTKVFALSGMVHRTGLVEVAMGTPVREIVHQIGGGIPGGKHCKAVQIGGPSGGCIPERHLDIATDYEKLKEFGAIMGSGGLVVLDESTCMVDLAKYFMEFIQSESCGKCIPCREGTRRMLEILQALTRSRGSEQGIDCLLRFQGVVMLEQLAEVIRSTSLCGLGQSAPNPVLNTLRWFRDEYEAHVFDRSCPAGACQQLVGAPCQTGCPVGTEVWRYVAHVGRGEFAAAYRVIREANPFPSVCARVCHHPCEATCRCGSTGADPIAVRALKRFVVDTTNPETVVESRPLASATGHRVAIVGAGPAGLTAAHYLSIRGHHVTVFERESEPGGMLVSGIPEYRLPRDVLRREIARLLNEHIELRCAVALGRDFTLDELTHAYGAVYLALGSHRSHRLGLADEQVDGVHSGMAFLKAHNLRHEPLARGRVGVVGGGNSAFDAARVAVRQPGVQSVVLLYRRTEDEMPAFPEEREAARAEGIEVSTLVTPVAVRSADGRLSGLRLIRNALGEPDASGRCRPVPVPDSEFDLALDTLIVAISEQPQLEGLGDLRTNRWGAVEANPESFVTDRPGVFAGGDLIRGPSTVIHAIADGKRVALMIDHYLAGKQLRTFPKVQLPRVYVAVAPDEGGSAAASGRVSVMHLPAERRQGNFAEVEQCLVRDEAIREARRCLRCDLEFTHPERADHL